MKNKTREEELVLYHGTLEELNSRDPNKQYKFAEKLHLILSQYAILDKKPLDRLREEGYDGLVNFIEMENRDHRTIQGTPINRIRNH